MTPGSMHSDQNSCRGAGRSLAAHGSQQPHGARGPVLDGLVKVDRMLGSGWESHNFEMAWMPVESCGVQCMAIKTRAVVPAPP